MVQHEAEVQTLKDVARESKRKVQELIDLDVQEDNIRNLEAKVLWINVHRVGDALDKQREELEVKLSALHDEQQALDSAAAEVDELGDVDAIKTVLENVQKEYDGIAGEVEAKTKAVSDQKRFINATVTGIKRLTTARSEHSKRLTDVSVEVRT